MANRYLPEDIVERILERLPVRSLCRFKCVSRSWRSLISSPRFVKNHLKGSTFSSLRIIFTTTRGGMNMRQCSVRSLMNEPLAYAASIDCSTMIQPSPAVFMPNVVGYCQGLVCINENDLMFLWNPSTKVFAKLPFSGVDERILDSAFGFGYSESTDDYKVLHALADSENFVTFVFLYSLRSNSWKTIGDFGGRVPLDNSDAFLNGKLHFIVLSWWNIIYIVSVDIDSEEIVDVEQPDYEEDQYYDSPLSIGVLGGCICALYRYEGEYIDVWIMKEYGVKETWVKMTTILCIDCRSIGNPMHMKPLIMLPSGSILMKIEDALAIYDMEDNSFRHCQIQGLRYVFDAHVYVESLVSPPICDNQGR